MVEAANAAAAPQVAYLQQGQGFPLVLVHGYLGGATSWQQQLDTLGKDFDVIAPELPGYGSSSNAIASASIDAYAMQVLGLLDDIGISQFHLLGHSMGGMIAQQIAVIAPERVARLVCYGTGPQGVLPDRFETIQQSRIRLEKEGVGPTARHIAATWFIKGESAPHYPSCAKLGESVSTASALAGLTAMESWDGRAALGCITQPTLIVWGDNDRSYGWQQPEALWTGIANSNLAVLPGCGHNAHQEKPDLFNDIIRNFLKEGTQDPSQPKVKVTTN